jgi:imidazoleglycerol-phosphate dehydratase
MANTARVGSVHRKTKETDIELTLKLDGQGVTSIQSGVSFMDHMLTLFGVHGFFDLDVKGAGDVEVDDHHTVEDLGICLGQAFKKALGDLSGICRYGFSVIPMDEALAHKNFSGLFLCTQALHSMSGCFTVTIPTTSLRQFSRPSAVLLDRPSALNHEQQAHFLQKGLYKLGLQDEMHTDHSFVIHT